MTTGTRSYSTTNLYGGRSQFHTQSVSWNGSDGRTNPDGSVKDNAYTKDVYTQTDSKLATRSCFYNSPTPNVFCEYPSVGSGLSASLWDGSDENKLLNKLAEKVRTHDFNMGIALGEGRQTVQLVLSTVVGLKKSFIAGLAKEFGQVARYGGTRRLTQGAISDVYLKTVFGALPLINDCFEAAKAYEAITGLRKTSVSVVHRVGRSVEASNSPSNYYGPGRIQESRRILYEMTERLSQARELGLLSPYETLWEITPWSFLFDYFLPIGSYLENLAVIPHLKGRFVYTIKREGKAAALLKPPKDSVYGPGWITDFYMGGRSECTVFHFSRSVPGSLTVPAPSFINLRQALKPWRIANIVALSHQQVLQALRPFRSSLNF